MLNINPISGQRKKTDFRGLNTQFIIYFLLFSYIPLFFFSIVGYYLNKDIIRKVYENSLLETNKSVAGRVEDFISSKKEIIRNLYDTDLGQDSILEPEHFGLSLSQLKEFDLIFFVHNNKSYLVKGISSGLENEIRDLDILNNSVVFLESKELFILRMNPGDDLVVYTGFGPSQIQKILKSFNKDSDHTITLKRSGMIISAGAVESIKAAEQKDSFLKKPKDSFDEIFYDPPYIHQESIIGDDWTVRSTKFASGFYKELRKFLIEILIANILIGILMLASALFLARRITTPIRSLVSAVHKISKGDLKRPIHIESRDEIKILADEFELMRQKLLESYTNLEMKIEERTKALKEAQFQISHQEKMASLGLMAAGIAHEIGNPLTGISSMAQILRRKSTDPKFIEYLETILKNTERISKIVRELVDIAKPSSYEAGIVNLNEIIRNAAEFVKYDRRSKNVNLELELDPQLPELHLVADQLLQVFINVLINAVDALTEQNDKIIIRSFRNGNDIKIQFEDNGIGIPDEHLKRIFEPFFTTKEVGKGTGLGLSVSYGIIKNFNGSIGVKSTPGKGSIFTISLPVNTRGFDDEG